MMWHIAVAIPWWRIWSVAPCTKRKLEVKEERGSFALWLQVCNTLYHWCALLHSSFHLFLFFFLLYVTFQAKISQHKTLPSNADMLFPHIFCKARYLWRLETLKHVTSDSFQHCLGSSQGYCACGVHDKQYANKFQSALCLKYTE